MHDMAAADARPRTTRARWRSGTSRTAPAPCRSTSTRAGADFAVGCGYKYLNGGPGAPAFVCASPSAGTEQLRAAARRAGWAMPRRSPSTAEYRPAAGIARFSVGTPPILALAALECGVDLLLEVDLAALRAQVGGAHRPVHRAWSSSAAPASASRSRRPRDAAAARQPGGLAPPGRLCDHAGADRARRDRRLPRAGHPALRLRAALHALRRRVGRGRAPAPGAGRAAPGTSRRSGSGRP